MLFRFGVVVPARMTEGGVALLVAGSRPELGQWDPQRALPMKPARPTAPRPAQEPTLWLAEAALPDHEAAAPFWYKFLRRQGDDVTWEGKGGAAATACPPRCDAICLRHGRGGAGRLSLAVKWPRFWSRMPGGGAGLLSPRSVKVSFAAPFPHIYLRPCTFTYICMCRNISVCK